MTPAVASVPGSRCTGRNPFDGIASFSALRVAARRTAADKRAKPGPAAFLANLEIEILRLERELRGESYRPGRYKTIEIFDPKHRIVSAAPFRDRVVHHAFCAVDEPLFERGFVHDSYANRKGKERPLPVTKGTFPSCAALRCLPALSGDRPRDSET